LQAWSGNFCGRHECFLPTFSRHRSIIATDEVSESRDRRSPCVFFLETTWVTHKRIRRSGLVLLDEPGFGANQVEGFADVAGFR
jgi:hypothetical protein